MAALSSAGTHPIVRPVRPPPRTLERLITGLVPHRTPSDRIRAAGWARVALRTIEREQLHVLTPDMAEYPQSFRELGSPPPAVFAAGRLELLEADGIAVVGTRSCTPHGLEAATRIARGVAAAGVTVISGLARGIDGAAHRAAGPARTIGVLGCGVDVVYPADHRDLQRDIGRRGLLLSEQLPGAPPAAHHFPERNRLIAALAAAVVVVEAPARSGALITSDAGLEMGLPVFAVPGQAGAVATAGTRKLISDGAILVSSAREVLEALSLPLPPDDADEDAPPPELYGVGLALWRLLGHGPRHADALTRELGLEPHQGLASLLALEVQGHARQLPGMRFVRA